MSRIILLGYSCLVSCLRQDRDIGELSAESLDDQSCFALDLEVVSTGKELLRQIDLWVDVERHSGQDYLGERDAVSLDWDLAQRELDRNPGESEPFNAISDDVEFESIVSSWDQRAQNDVAQISDLFNVGVASCERHTIDSGEN